VREQLAYLRAALEQIQQELIEAEAGLADRLAGINAFEFEFEARVGHLIDKLQALEEEIQRYHERIEIVRNRQIFGNPYLSVDTQYRRAWQAPQQAPAPPPQPVGPADEAQIKKLYRQLARRCHPDLALDETDRARRTQIMAAINDAYAARSLAELIALVREVDRMELAGQAPPDWTEAQLVQALETELNQCRRRLHEIEEEVRQLSQRPSVRLSLEVRLARRRGRDLLAEMAAELEQKINRRTVERDMLKAQFDQLGSGQGFIDIP
jgi:hypothetical protein